MNWPLDPQKKPHVGGDRPELQAASLYLNRELSWLEFNARVLAEARSDQVPLLERLKFHAIASSNIDEFFMVRVAGLKQQLSGDVSEFAPDGMTVLEQLSAISSRVHELVAEQNEDLITNVFPRLAELGIVLVKPEAVPPDALALLDTFFRDEVFPVLTPIAIDPGHPFPHVRNKSLNIGVMLSREGASEAGFGVVQVPTMLPRLLAVQGVLTPSGGQAKHAFVLLEDLIARHVGAIFPGVGIKGVYVFRVTRNFDLEIDEEEAEDLLQTIQQELRRRERGNAVRLEVLGDPPASSLIKLIRALKLDPERDVYACKGLLNIYDLMKIVSLDDCRDLRDEPFTSQLVPPLREADDIFAAIRDGDVLLHHPYESFDLIVDFISRAAEDPDVLAIKQTLYRAGGESAIVKALTKAAESGKQVTAVVELKARFDEESNIVWARTLEQSGVHVVYGLMGLKTHAKCLLVVRREKGRLRRYAHLATGNYNSTTARLYTDVSLLTFRQDICEDVSSLFNLLTGYSAPPKWNKLVVAPIDLHERLLALISREIEHSLQKRPCGITVKMNSLLDAEVIEALYKASQAGVPIRLLVRGICALRPGLPGVSETIEVRAIVDRFLEHGRIFHFTNGGVDEVYLASADWMPRNFHRRVEVMIPIDDAILRANLMEMLVVSWNDNVKSWALSSDGRYTRVVAKSDVPAVRSQQRFIDLAREKVRIAELTSRSSKRLHLFQVAPLPLDLQVLRVGRRKRRDKKNR